MSFFTFNKGLYFNRNLVISVVSIAISSFNYPIECRKTTILYRTHVLFGSLLLKNNDEKIS